VSGATRVAPSRPATVATATPPAIAAPPATPSPGDLPLWTIQVSSFRSRALAEELRSRLAARGFDAHVFPSLTEDGRPRYRVRVGAYAARGDAERVAAELRSERGLNPLVTSARTR
jgi:cell division protein FtsN